MICLRRTPVLGWSLITINTGTARPPQTSSLEPLTGRTAPITPITPKKTPTLMNTSTTYAWIRQSQISAVTINRKRVKKICCVLQTSQWSLSSSREETFLRTMTTMMKAMTWRNSHLHSTNTLPSEIRIFEHSLLPRSLAQLMKAFG